MTEYQPPPPSDQRKDGTTRAPDDLSWLTPDFYASIYREFIQLRFHFAPFLEDENPLLNPDLFSELHANAPASSSVKQFVRQIRTNRIQSFLSSLCNELNSMNGWLLDLSAWKQTLAPFSGSQRYHLIQQFVAPLSTLMLTFPYAFKSQFEYAGSKIAGMLSLEAAEKQPKTDRDYKPKHLRLTMEHVKGSEPLLELTEKINSRSFEEQTNEFRRYQVHRVPIQIEFGLAFDVSVSRKDDMISIGSSQIAPLSIDNIIDQSREQHRACHDALLELRQLILANLNSRNG